MSAISVFSKSVLIRIVIDTATANSVLSGSDDLSTKGCLLG